MLDKINDFIKTYIGITVGLILIIVGTLLVLLSLGVLPT